VNGLAAIPFALIQGAGKPRITATLHMVELPIYLVVLFVCLHRYGITGAALAWSLRMLVDLVLLHSFARRYLAPQAAPPGVHAP
jgi:O-antigen/teichoic acid export membrane protein